MAITETRIEMMVFRIENANDFKTLKNDSLFLDSDGNLYVKKFNEIHLILLSKTKIEDKNVSLKTKSG